MEMENRSVVAWDTGRGVDKKQQHEEFCGGLSDELFCILIVMVITEIYTHVTIVTHTHTIPAVFPTSL